MSSPEFSSQRRALEERVKELERKLANEMKETQDVVEKLAKERGDWNLNIVISLCVLLVKRSARG